MNADVVRVLKDARALIADVSGWCRHAPARTADGTQVAYSDPEAEKFCALGAVARSHYLNEYDWNDPVIQYLGRGFGLSQPNAIPRINDTPEYGHQTVVAGFDRAIALAEEDFAGAPLPVEITTSQELVKV